jgi:flagellar biosynthesis protein FlhA
VSIEAAAPRTDRTADFLVPLGIIGIVLMMVLPLPAFLLDLLLACSMALAIGVFLTALFIETALEFSAFPAVVLVATLLRLSLNVATTRLILLHGSEGHGAAGSVVEAFGRFVVEGNVLVGLVVFLILAVINFIVVTKGAGRVAEVAARFTLDAMPGKQMAVDAEVSSGSLTADQARARRRSLEREADFYGAMDGASKFVHGDAIAGLLITAINLVGGLILGVSRGMDVGTAAETFSVLSVGDALASQIPALLISAAAGIVVTRSATGDQLGRALGAQLFGRRQPVVLTAGLLTVLGLMPGMPTVPCITLALALAVVGRGLRSPGQAAASPKVKTGSAPDPKRSAAEVDAALALDLLSLEVGYELVSLVDASRGGTLLDRVASLRQVLARELGVIMPAIHVCDNLELAPGAYRLLVSGNEVGRGTCASGRVLAVDPRGTAPPVAGDKTLDPTFGMPARWILPRDKEMAEALGYTVVDHATVIATHLGELLRNNAHKLLGRQEVQHLLENLSRTAPKVVDDVVPNLLPLGDVLRVLRNLVREGVSIRDLRTILESLGELSSQSKDPEQLTELVRERLAAHITSRVKGADGKVAILTLEPKLEDAFRKSLREIATGSGGPVDPELLRQVTAAAERTLQKFTAISAVPLLATPPDIRRYVRAVFERRIPQLGVVSFREIDPSASLHVLDRLALPMTPLPQ